MTRQNTVNLRERETRNPKRKRDIPTWEEILISSFDKRTRSLTTPGNLVLLVLRTNIYMYHQGRDHVLIPLHGPTHVTITQNSIKDFREDLQVFFRAGASRRYRKSNGLYLVKLKWLPDFLSHMYRLIKKESEDYGW